LYRPQAEVQRSCSLVYATVAELERAERSTTPILRSNQLALPRWFANSGAFAPLSLTQFVRTKSVVCPDDTPRHAVYTTIRVTTVTVSCTLLGCRLEYPPNTCCPLSALASRAKLLWRNTNENTKPFVPNIIPMMTALTGTVSASSAASFTTPKSVAAQRNPHCGCLTSWSRPLYSTSIGVG
jgi:hypothetical protein